MEKIPLVTVEGVCLTYHEPTAETKAIERMSFHIHRGEFVSIVGPSGCGKTSILSMLAGLITPSEGSIQIHSTKRPGYMLQHDHLLDWRTIEGNIMLALDVKHIATEENRAYALSLLDTYGLSEFRYHYPRQLSGGMRQKVALIRTLAASPELLLLDEPFSALDYQTRLRIADEIHTILRAEGKTAILVTHDIAEAISMCDRIYVLSSRPATIKSTYLIELSVEGKKTPLLSRKSPEFSKYFDVLWKELEENG